MSKEPGDRFQDAHQLGVALLGHADGRARLEAGSEDLAAYMAELFPAGAARWGRLLDPSAADHLFDGTDSKEEEKAALGLSDTLTRTRPPGAELPRALEGETVQLLNPREFPVEGSQRTEGPRPKGWPVVWLASHLVRRPRTLAGVATVAAAVLLWMTIDVSPPSPGKAGPEAGAVVRAEASTALCALPSPIALVPSAVGAPSSAAMGSSSIRQRSLEPRKDVPSTGKRAPGKPATAARRPMRRLAVAAAAPAAGHARWSATSVADQLEPSPYADRTR
jgi:hypothetical protein